jgi:diguanylate cyclase (GGDEF)-like protein
MRLLALLFSFMGASPLAAHATATSPARLVETCRIRDESRLTLDAAIAVLTRCDHPAARASNGTIWRAYATPPQVRADAAQVWRLMIDNHRVHHVDIWVLMADGTRKQLRYDATAPAREWASGNYFSLPLYAPATVVGIVTRHHDAVGVSLTRAPWMMPAREYAAYDRNVALGYGIAVGMLLLTILFHANLFFAIRRRFQLIYVGHVALLFVYALCYSNGIRLVWPELSADGVSRLLGFAMAMATATGISFVVEFLGPAALPRWLRIWARVAAFGSMAAGITYSTVPTEWVATAFYLGNGAALNTLFTTIAILAVGCVNRNSSAVALAVGWAMPIVVSLLYPLRALGIVSDLMIPDGLMMAATTLECLILSLPVTARIRALRVEHERAQERHLVLERQAQTDVLTGLANRRGFRDALLRASAGLHPAASLGVLVIDIDHFKRVNDRYGHGTGDAILQHVAAYVARVAGAGAIVARYGGEEFVVALTGHDIARAGTIAERIRTAVGASFGPESPLPAVTVSIGVASGPAIALEALVAEADRALYRAKEAGRNRVMLASGGGARDLSAAAA